MNDIIRINASRPYDVIIGSGILREIGQETLKRCGRCAVAIVADDTVESLYAGLVTESLTSAGLKSCSFVFPHGEQSKTVATLTDFISFMAANGITRGDTVLTLGGGVCGDLGGLAAALYMRGIGFIQVPTTLLAMTDSSVGGKTAVDIPQGKNLIGAFHQPSFVLCDTETLGTLPHSILRDGYAEIIKYGVLFNGEFFKDLSYDNDLQSVVAASIRFKRDIVEADEKEHGVRALLNFGHTIGHAIEKLSGYTITHGEAVAIGMVRAAKIGAAYGLQDYSREIAAKTIAFGFRTKCPYSGRELFEAAMADKKRTADGIRLVLPEEIGKCGLYDIDAGTFLGLLEKTE